LKISFFSENIDFQLLNSDYIQKWIEELLHDSKATASTLTFIFCSDNYLLEINRKYLNHDYYTDIITFPYRQHPEPLEADIYISIDRVKENAMNLGASFQDELLRVIIHGVLHLLGYKDKNPEDVVRMRAKEEQCLQRYRERFDPG
jgi:rRNA maturation RNase YbeY